MLKTLFLFLTLGTTIFTKDSMNDFEPLKTLESLYNDMQPAQINNEEACVWFTGIPHPLFNSIMHVTHIDKIDSIIMSAPTNTPICFWVHEQNHLDSLGPVLVEKGFQPVITCPLMQWPVKPIEKSPHEIKIADDETFYNILATTFHWDNVIKLGFVKLMSNVAVENYIVYLDGQPVGTGTIFSTGKSGGIFNISTLPASQKRGCGKAMMQHLMNRASQLGLENLVLLSSPEAEKLYTDLNFTKCFDITAYAK